MSFPKRRIGQLALAVATLVAYYFVGHWIIDPPAEDPIFDEARCKRAALNASKGKDYDPQLLNDCIRRGIIPPLTSP